MSRENKEFKKIIIVGRIHDLIPYYDKLKMVELTNIDMLNEFFESKFVFAGVHGKNCESIKELFNIDESQAIFIDIKMLSSLEKYCPIEEKKLYEFLNTKKSFQ